MGMCFWPPLCGLLKKLLMYKCLASDDLCSYVVLENVDKAQMKIRSRKENVAGMSVVK